MFNQLLIIFIVVLSITTGCFADNSLSPEETVRKYQAKVDSLPTLPKGLNLKGWDYLIARLIQTGVSKEELLKIYTDPRMPKMGRVSFKLKPRESKSIYRGFISKANLNTGRTFINNNQTTFNQVEKIYNVPKEVITAILLVESGFGRNTGRSLIINRLSRLGGISAPENLKFNLAKMQKEDPSIKWSDVIARATYLEDTFMQEIPATIKICKENKIDIFNFKGSSAGAFGWAQFLPSSYLKFAVDFDKNGKKSLFSRQDAIASIANYLNSNGWNNKSDREVIWSYNKSDAYIDTILGLAERF